MSDPDPGSGRTVRLVVAYDGTSFHGFARNDGVRTVAGVLEEALGRVLRQPVTLTAAGRTDKGVHARGQVVSFVAAGTLDAGGLARSVNRQCGPELVIREAALAGHGFDARRSARWRRYRYSLLTTASPDPFTARWSWHVPGELSLPAMRAASVPLVGEHDFSAFCRRPPVPRDGPPPSLVRRVLDAEWTDVGGGRLRFEIRATAFCHQMVRSVVGALVEVGRGRRHASDVAGLLRSRDRSRAPDVAPPHGLCLWDVGY